METKENNNTASTHQEKARKLKKLRRWQIVVSLLGIAILIWGIIQVTCLFLNYKRTETSNDAQIEQYISPVNLRASGYIKKNLLKNRIRSILNKRIILMRLCVEREIYNEYLILFKT